MFCFVGFGTDRRRREEAMKTAGRESPNHRATLPQKRAHGAVGQNRFRSVRGAAKQEKFRPTEKCFFLTLPFIEPCRGIESTASTPPIAGLESNTTTRRCRIIGPLILPIGCDAS